MSLPIGHRQERLTVIGPPFMANRRTHYVCECDCGAFTVVSGSNLGDKAHCTKSCGCLYREKLKTGMNYRHGGARVTGKSASSLYGSWQSMLARCEKPTRHLYERYGGRGIRVCDEWHDFAVFQAWALANGWRQGLTIDRKENDGHYEPGNCQWLTRAQNSAKAQRQRKGA